MDNKNFPQSNERVVGSRNILTIIVSVVITALIVGGVVYAWQKISPNKTEQSLQREIISLQNQIKELQGSMEQKQPVTLQEEDNKKQPVTPQEEDNKNQTSTEPTTPDNWKTYSNDELGYSIDYPSEWKAKEHKEGKVYISYPGPRQMPEGGGSIVISVEDKTLEQFIEQYNMLDGGTSLSKIIKQERYTLNGIKGYKLVGTTAIGIDRSFIFISRANKSYIIRFHDHDDDQLEIIETFRFN
ncbi:MAG: hypothetical protein GF335_03145 [Candidatus Moranbacteria bacterium]|nr:hypothetical protein [Candidatus Moranbacteria bacterium]